MGMEKFTVLASGNRCMLQNEVLAAVWMKIQILWDGLLCDVLNSYPLPIDTA
jgi:hypothetical protein